MKQKTELLKSKILNSKIVKIFYKGIFYMHLGKRPLANFTAPLQEINFVILFLTMVIGIDLRQYKLAFVLVSASVFFIFIGIGIVYKALGLQATEDYTAAYRSPVVKETLDAARKINKSKRL